MVFAGIFIYLRRGAFRGSENARQREQAECFRAVYGYKPAGAPYPPFPLWRGRTAAETQKKEGRKKNISVKLKYQFISLPKRKVKAPEQKAQDSKNISIARKKGKAGKGKMFFNARLCGWKCNCALILMKWLMRWKFSQSLSRISSEESFQITDSVSKREKRRHEWRKMATNFPTTEF